MIKFYKMMFLTTLMISTLISISSYTWLGMWLGLEINLISMIPLMKNSKNSLTSEASIKYFITQAVASMVLIFSIMLLMNSTLSESNLLMKINTSIILNSSLLMKMGAAPFHFWFPEIMEGLNWFNSTLMLTWQKIAPMAIFSYTLKTSEFMITIIILSMAISGMMGINQISLRKILTYSSINHIGWMLSLMLTSEKGWMIYFFFYSFINLSMISIFKPMNTFFLSQLFCSIKNNSLMKMSFMVNFLSLGGVPPFIGFFPKWMAIQSMIEQKMYLLILIMILFTMITLFMYTRSMFSALTMNSSSLNWMKMKNKFNWSIKMNIITNSSLIFCTGFYTWI